MSYSFDTAIVGAGIVGMATAMTLSKAHPKLRICVVEKEAELASHQTGHNSGVIHSGIYYRPGSLKARLCISGARKLIRFCEEHGIPYEVCGKVVIATHSEEIPRLHELYRRGTANGVIGMKLLDPLEVKQYEPHATCVQGLRVPNTGIVDFKEVTKGYARVFQLAGGTIFLNHKVVGVGNGDGGIILETDRGPLSVRTLINCAGLYADHLARMAGAHPPCRIVPFRGEYYEIRKEKRYLVKNLIYPVPDPRFPFLGVHFTRMINGKVEAGPNAVLAWAREGYLRSQVSRSELMEVLNYQGFRRLLRRYWKPGLDEMIRSYFKSRFVKALRRLVPEIKSTDLTPGGAGVRAQALSEDGTLLDDFTIIKKESSVHVLNAPSPAATSALAIAEHITGISSALLGL